MKVSELIEKLQAMPQDLEVALTPSNDDEICNVRECFRDPELGYIDRWGCLRYLENEIDQEEIEEYEQVVVL